MAASIQEVSPLQYRQPAQEHGGLDVSPLRQHYVDQEHGGLEVYHGDSTPEVFSGDSTPEVVVQQGLEVREDDWTTAKEAVDPSATQRPLLDVKQQSEAFLLEKGTHAHTEQPPKSRSRRICGLPLKWFCLLLVVILAVIIAIAVGALSLIHI